MPRSVDTTCPDAPHRTGRLAARPWRETLKEVSNKDSQLVKQQELLEESQISPPAALAAIAAPDPTVITGERIVTVLTEERVVVESGAVITARIEANQTNASYGWTQAQTNYIQKVIWQHWKEEQVKGWYSATTSATTNHLWLKWNEDRCTGTSANYWHNQYQAVWHVWNEANDQKRMSEAEREAHMARRREEARRAEEARKDNVAKVQVAMDKAKKLLMMNLNEQQKEELTTKGYFHCKSQQGHLYRIYKGTHGNVKKLDSTGKKEVEKLCIQPNNVPDWDAMLAQKLHIEYNEDDFRKTANITKLAN